MKEIVLLRNVMIGGKPYERGDKAQVSDHDAAYLVNIGKAEWPPEPKAKAAKKAGQKETADSKAAEQSEKRAE